jgi:colanic acid biosynthesis glycosyl transferase WcaI
MTKKKILIHIIAFSPDGVSTAYLYNDIATGCKNSGYDVVVLTTTPHYNIVPGELARQPLKKCWLGLYYKSSFNGIPVYHVPQKKFKSFSARAIGFVYWHILSLLLGIFQRNVSLVLSPSPPLTIGLVSIIIAWFKRAKVVYNVQEIYPDLLVNQGNLKSGMLFNLLRRLESFVYNHSDRVTTIDTIFYNTIHSRFRDPSRLSVIPNFVDTDIYKPVTAEKLSRLDKNLFPDKPVLKVMYAGNIGNAQDWKPVIHTAKKVADLPIGFWIIGEGVMKDWLISEIEKEKLTNIHLIPYQARDTMAEVVGYADLHFIFMDPQMEGQGFPSKVYTIMACKKPLLVASGETSPLYHFLKDKDCSFLAGSADIAERYATIESSLRTALADPSLLASMGNNGFEVIEQQYSQKAVLKQYVDLCNELTA